MKTLTDEHHRRDADEATKRGVEWKSSWLLKGRSLERAADILWLSVDSDFSKLREGERSDTWDSIVGPFLLLAGLTVENYLKALCVVAHGAHDAKGKFKFGHHDLIKLAGESSVQFTTEEIELFERLEYFIVFAGRYPAPKNPDLLLPRVRADGSWSNLSYMFSSDYGRWKDLAVKLREKLGA